MAMSGKNSVMYAIHMFHQILNLRPVLIRQAISCRIRDIHYGSPGLDHGLHDTGQIFIIRTPGILTVEFYVLHVLFSVFRGGDRTLYNLLSRGVKLVFDMRSADSGMYTSPLSESQRLGCHVDIFLHRTGQGTDGRPSHGLWDLNHTLKIPGTGDRETSLDHINT